MIKKLLSLLNPKNDPPVVVTPIQEPVKPKKPRKKKVVVQEQVQPKTAKEIATENKEPYIEIVGMELDPNNVHDGAFEFDWNDYFIVKLIRAGYKMKDTDTDNMIVDRWFRAVCKNVVLELYEQDQADPDNRDVHARVINKRPLGDGRTEIY